jgi:glycosyltransferase involved in cell wall biosynthesis
MLGGWPEPFGLVAIESMATGTPVIGRRAGGLTEIVDHGTTGYLVDDIDEARFAVRRIARLDRERIVTLTRHRFSADRMIDEYEAAYARLVDETDDLAGSSRAAVAGLGRRSGKDRLVPLVDVGH